MRAIAQGLLKVFIVHVSVFVPIFLESKEDIIYFQNNSFSRQSFISGSLTFRRYMILGSNAK